jgi:methionine-gamma-lyase
MIVLFGLRVCRVAHFERQNVPMNTKLLGINTKLIHAGQTPDWTGALTVPIYQTSTFAFHSAKHGASLFAGEQDGYIYTRIGNPTVHALEENVAELEGGCGGIATSSGMGAVCTVYLGLLESGAHVVSTASVYGPSRGLLENDFSRFGVESSYVDTSDLDQVRQAMRSNTKLVYIETPSNPSMKVSDIAQIADIAHAGGALLVVDNTFASPYLQNPLALGADVVLHSVTKFINGHADVVGGIIVAKEKSLYKRLRKTMIMSGCNMDPHQAFLVLRGLKTLGIRVERAQQNAMKIARWLEEQPEIETVLYVGLETHPEHELAKRQMKGFGTMISFELRGGLEAGCAMMDAVRLATLAVSLGGVETLIEHPASMTHAGLAREDRQAAGITDGLVRYSVGIEDVEDLIADLRTALNAIPQIADARRSRIMSEAGAR